MRKRLAIVCLVVLAFGCKKKDDPQPNDPISVIPEIELVSVSPGTINEFEDILFTIKYTDGDGDLGTSDADEKVLEIIDNRFPVTHQFHVQPLAPSGSSITIQGNLSITLENVILKDQQNSSESATFTIRLKDQAGNWSNSITSSSVTINK